MGILESFLRGLSRILLEAGLMAVAVVSIQLLCRRRLAPRWRCALWGLVLARLVLPVLPSSPFSVFNAVPTLRRALASVSAVQPRLPTLTSATSTASTPPRPNSSLAPSLEAPGTLPVPLPSVDPRANTEVIAGAPGRLTEGPVPGTTPFRHHANPRDPASNPTAASSRSWPWGSMLVGAWIAGVLALGVQLTRSTLWLRRRITGLTPSNDAPLLERVRACQGDMGVEGTVEVFEAPAVTTPALYGLVRPRLLLPPGFTRKFSAEEQQFVFLHELAHLKRHDLAVNWVVTTLLILHWFNPLLWLAFARYRFDRELACDALALNRVGEARSHAYGRTILRLLEGFSPAAAAPGLIGILEERQLLRQRLSAIAEFTPAHRGAGLAAGLAIALSALALTDASKEGRPLPPVRPLTLTNILTQTENQSWLKEGVWLNAPRGTQDFGGIEFHLEGLVQLQGKGFEDDGRHYRQKVIIPLIQTNRVDKKMEVVELGTNIATLHLITGTAYDAKPETKIAELVWRYTDGTSRRIPIQYAVHVRDWWRPRYEEPAHLPYGYSKVIWRATHAEPAKSGKTLRLYRVSFANPDPKRTLRQLELVSAMARPSLFVAALTLDPLKLGERPDQSPDLEEEDPPLTGHLSLLVQGPAGTPLAGAEVRALIKQSSGKPNPANFKKTYATDGAGLADVQRPSEGVERLEIVVSKDGYGPGKMTWDTKTGDTIPPVFTLKLRTGVDIGGVVVDPDGNPVAAATLSLVRFWPGGEGRKSKGEEEDFPAQECTTDDNGQWRARNLPPGLLDHIAVRAEHPDFIGASATVGASKETEKEFREGTHRLTLKRGIEVRGRVTDTQEKPIAEATVWAGMRNFATRRETRTDSEGRFVFHNVTEGSTQFSVAEKGHKPESKSVNVKDGAEEVRFRLSAGRVIRARVQNESGDPIPGVRVVLEGEGDIGRSYEFSTTTDADGRFEWDGAPDERAQFYFGSGDYEQKRDCELKPDIDNIVTLHKKRQVQGQVLDAGTGQAITTFKIAAGRKYPGQEGRFYADWPGSSEFTDPQGRFSVELNEEQTNGIQAGADDYADETQSLPEANQGIVRVVLRLKPSKTLQGIVVAADGKPVAGASVLITGAGLGGSSAQLTHGHLRTYGNGAKSATTDEGGHFRITSPPETGIVVAAGDPGFVKAPLTEVQASGVLTLQPYGRIEVTSKVGNEPGVGQAWFLTLPLVTVNPDFDTYKATTDAQGRLAIEQVPAGPCTLVRLVQTSPNSWQHSYQTPVTVTPGETTRVTLGGTGATLSGHVSLETSGNTAVTISGYLNSPPLDIPSGLSAEDRQAFLQSPEWQEQIRNRKSYAVTVGADGALRLDSIPPGTYTLIVIAVEPGAQPWSSKTVAQFQTPITVPSGADPSSPMALGELHLAPVEEKQPAK